MSTRAKFTYPERQIIRRNKLRKALEAMERSAKSAPDAWGQTYRDAIAATLAVVGQLDAVEIPGTYVRARTTPTLSVGQHVMFRSEARTATYESILPNVREGGRIVEIFYTAPPTANVVYGDKMLGPVVLKYLCAWEEHPAPVEAPSTETKSLLGSLPPVEVAA